MRKMASERVRETREDPRITRTRNLIRDALQEMVHEKPFSEISVQDIAERATINRATFYAHFEDKFALLEDLVRTNYCAELARHDPQSAEDVSELLEAITVCTAECVRSHKKCKVDKEFEPQIERAMQDVLYKYLISDLGEAAALVVSSAVIGVTMQWRAGKYKQPVEDLTERLVTVLADGVRLQHKAVLAAS